MYMCSQKRDRDAAAKEALAQAAREAAGGGDPAFLNATGVAGVWL
jgi:hypothetical protein